NLVHRLLLQPSSVTFSAPRPPDEQSCEFLASRDNWFRPVQARTGPDGALWIVDMYRFVIEHPDWIPAERLAKLDVRAGADKGRIYRVLPKGIKPRPVPDLTRVSLPKLAELLDSPNGTERDRVHQELAFSARALELKAGRESEKVKAVLTRLARIGDLPAVRLQAACVLDGLGMINPALLGSQLRDSAAPVRANAIRLSEQFLSGTGRAESAAAAKLGPEILALTTDPDLHVRFQLALSLGEWDDPRAGVALGQLASASLGDKWMRAAVLSSATRWPAEILKRVLAADSRAAGRSEMIRDLIATAVGEAQPSSLGKVIAVVAPGAGRPREEWQLAALDSLLESFDRKSISLGSLAAQGDLQLRSAIDNLGGLFNWAHEIVADPHAKASLKISAIHLLGRDPKTQASDLELLARMLDGEISPRIKAAVFESLKRLRLPAVPEALLKNWAMRPPSIRQAALETLLAREEWVPPLLDALEKGVVGANEISPSNRQRLLRDPNKAVQSRAQALWKNQGAARSQVITKYHDALILPGDPSKGALVFANTCTPCHFLRGQGHAVGPNLAALADKTPADFLTAILDPNAVVEPRFIAYNIETKDGRSLSGVVSAETATTLTLVQGGGARETILRADIDSIRASGLSLMPEGLEQNLKPQDFADLIAYLKTSPRPFGSADSAQADLARKKFSESKPTGVARILKATDDLPYPGWLGSLPLHYCRQTDGTGKVIWQTAPAPSHLAAKGSTIFRLPVGMGFASNPSGNFRLSLDGKPALSFDVAITDNTWESKDGKVRLRYTVMENNTEDSNGILTMEIDNALLSPGKPVMCEVTGSASNSQRWFGIYELPTASTRASR
ncbi:MAG TPA: c-type cytochrome, partial [Verrucomicrobiae bacterium]|nr:c-type cytochrome [Verrucomicrobiae bacterium]